jgi:hypothetical protein
MISQVLAALRRGDGSPELGKHHDENLAITVVWG